jgi:D-alanine-D-alanine ligase
MGMDKITSHQIFLAQGLSVPPYLVLNEEEHSSFELDRMPFPFPVVVKPASEGSSVGVSIVPELKGLEDGMKEAFRYGSRILIEQFISGKEVHVGILGERALGAIEIQSKTKFYDYTAKYVAGMSEHLYPAPLPPNLYKKVLERGLRAHKALGCSGYSRVDFLIDAEENLYLLEVNTLPGMTETSLMPEMARGAGIDFDALVEKILATASTGR